MNEQQKEMRNKIVSERFDWVGFGSIWIVLFVIPTYVLTLRFSSQFENALIEYKAELNQWAGVSVLLASFLIFLSVRSRKHLWAIYSALIALCSIYFMISDSGTYLVACLTLWLYAAAGVGISIQKLLSLKASSP